MKALLILCVFNENIKLERAANRISAFLKARKSEIPIEVLIVDDASTEETPLRVANSHAFHFLRHNYRRGIGYGIREGYQFGLSNGFDVLIMMAGNDKDDPAEIDKLIEPIAQNQADFVQGSRYLKGGKYGNMPFYRFWATRYIHPLLFSFISRQKITDSTNGFRAIRSEILRNTEINLSQSWLDQYELEPYLFYKAILLGYSVLEVPVTKIYPEKHLGYSKMRPVTGWWSILRPLIYLYLGIKK